MKAKAVIPLAVGLGVGLIAIKLVVDVVQRAKGAGGAGGVASVVMADAEIPVGGEITPKTIKLGKCPKGLLPSKFFDAPDKVAGRVARFSILPGVVIQPVMLAPEGTTPGLSVKIPAGHRAVAVKVDEFSSVAGFLKPGSRVDVIAVLTVKKEKSTETISRTILQNVEVAAVGQQLDESAESTNALTRSVTLIVKPDEAAQLHLASTKGQIRLAMRNQEDQVAAKGRGAQESELWGMAPAGGQKGMSFLGQVLAGLQQGKATRPADMSPPLAPSGDRPAWSPAWPVTVIRGGSTEQLVFASSNSFVRVDGSGGTIGRTGPQMPMSLGSYGAGDGTHSGSAAPNDGDGGSHPFPLQGNRPAAASPQSNSVNGTAEPEVSTSPGG